MTGNWIRNHIWFTVTSHEHHSISVHWELYCLFKILLILTKKLVTFRVIGPLWGECTRWFPFQRASDTEIISTSWRHHGLCLRSSITYIHMGTMGCLKYSKNFGLPINHLTLNPGYWQKYNKNNQGNLCYVDIVCPGSLNFLHGHCWCSGIMQYSHSCDAGSIPGQCSFFIVIRLPQLVVITFA